MFRQCSIVAEFYRRVQAVIWNRSLMRTKNRALGLVGKGARQGDLICVLYGCSVPVVLRKHVKSTGEILTEEEELVNDQEAAAAKLVRIFRKNKALQTLKHKYPRFKMKKRVGKDLSASTDRDDGFPDCRTSVNGGPDTPLGDDLPPNGTELKPISSLSTCDYVGTNGPVFSEPVTEISAIPAQRHVWFEFIGECYVHGMMDGEAIEKQNKEKLQRQLFELR